VFTGSAQTGWLAVAIEHHHPIPLGRAHRLAAPPVAVDVAAHAVGGARTAVPLDRQPHPVFLRCV
jgi:hypothetical protein